MIDPKPIWILVVIVAPSLFFGFGLLAAWMAWRKGYRPWFWLLSLGPIGALSMLLRPNLNRAETPEEREKWEQRADWTGGILSGVSLFFVMALPLVGMLVFFSLAVAPVPRAVIAVPAQSVETEVPLLDPPASAVESSDRTNCDQPSQPSADQGNGQPPTQ
jgi:hypothetical protein